MSDLSFLRCIQSDFRRAIAALALTLTPMLVGAGNVQADTVQLASPITAEAAGKLAPGLAVSYFYGTLFDHVDEFADRDPASGEPGAPLMVLDYSSLEDKVLTSTRYDAVGAHISGYIHLRSAGTYQFTIESNDGVRLHIGGKHVLEDPDVHYDQWSETGTVQASAPGWYPLVLWYFEKRNTSTLRLYWRPPGAPADGSYSLVPGEVLGHAPN
jgi:hypothetical protein